MGTDRHCSGVIGGADSRVGGVIGLSNISSTSSSLRSVSAGEVSRASGSAIGLGVASAGTIIGVGAGRGTSPDNDGKLLSSNVTSRDR